jgi:PAS domain S-box-containing protein
MSADEKKGIEEDEARIALAERQGAEEQRRRQESLNQMLLDAMPCVALLLKLKSREIVAMNRAAQRVGCQLAGTCYETWAKFDNPCPWCLAPQLWADGTAKQIEVEALGIVWDAHWEPISDDLYLHYAFDITEHKRAGQALRESERLYRLMAENMADVIWVLDVASLRFKYISPSVQKLRGYTPEEVMAQPMSEALTPESGDRIRALLVDRLSKFRAGEALPQSFVDEVDQPCKDGSIVHTEVTTSYLLNEEGQMEVVGVTRNINKRKRAEEALQKVFQEKQMLLRELQHRVKNSFALVVGMVDLMTDASPYKEVVNALSEVNIRIRAISTLYDLLFVTEAVAEARLDEYCSRIVASFHFPANILIQENYQELVTPAATATSVALIFTELLTNAVKHAFPDSRMGMITVSLEKTVTGALIKVEDDGIGYNAGIGFPEGAVTSGKMLGLSLVNSLVRQINGRFKMENATGVRSGTQCVVEFPL